VVLREAGALKLLHLLRHAKAAGPERAGIDHSRPLAPRGVSAGQALAAHLKDQDFKVAKIYCSTARRTRETYELLESALGDTPVAFRDRLYLIDIGDLLDFVHSLPDSADSALIIGHNPAFHEFSVDMAADTVAGQEEALAALTEKFPTGALCSLQFDCKQWRQVEPMGGKLTQFIRPRDLDADE